MNTYFNILPYIKVKIPKSINLSKKELEKRQFYHIPKVNDIKSYSAFLYPSITSCKYNNKKCYKLNNRL